MADLFPEIERRVAIGRAFDRWEDRRPWCWLPARVRVHVFRRFFLEREVKKLHG